MLRTYLGESFLNVQLDPGLFLKAVGVALTLMLFLALALYFSPVSVAGVMDAYPINEMGVAVSSGMMVYNLPVFGTLCHTLFAPIAVVGMFYVVGFAPCAAARPGWAI